MVFFNRGSVGGGTTISTNGTVNEIHAFFVSTGDLYAEMNQVYLRKVIEDCIIKQQYIYEPNEYALLYWLIHEKDIDMVCDKNIPDEISGGNIMYVVECASRNNELMRRAINKLRRVKFYGAFWHRNNTPMIYPRQKGA